MWVAAIQLNSTPDLEANLARAQALVEAAAARGARLVALPEHFACLGSAADTAAAAQPVDGPLVTRFRELTGKLGLFPPAEPFPQRTPGGPALQHQPASGSPGPVPASYRKLHLFDVDLPGAPPSRESEVTHPGDAVVTAALPGESFTAGLSICYDLRFPELFRAQVSRGANLLLLPAAFTVTTGRDHWEVLLRARAIENLSYVVAPAQCGQHVPGRRTYGRSLIIDPWGLILAQAPDGEGMILARLDYERLQRLRRELPCLRHRRLP